MKVVIQNVLNASVSINNKIVGSISRGFCLFVGFTNGDDEPLVKKIVNKLVDLRLFNDENGKTNLSLKDVNGEILSISQFTLYGSVKEGRRPAFINVMRPEKASQLYDYFNKCLTETGIHIEKGVFGADMKVSLINDGPFTMILDSEELYK